jgi:CDP-diacylglycerol--glycerol-3-phosphate 3-phosphatidyltransferase
MAGFGRWVRDAISRAADPVARVLVRAGVTPDMLTLIGFAGNIGVAALILSGRLPLAGLVMLGAGVFDTLDGAAARVSRRTDRSGALLDSVLDRYSEAAIFLGLLIHFYQVGHSTALMLTFLAIVGSLLVSYIRARAEGLRVECRVGFMQRGERVVLLAIGLLGSNLVVGGAAGALLGATPFLVGVLMLLAVLSNVTAIHRLVFSYAELLRAPRG